MSTPQRVLGHNQETLLKTYASRLRDDVQSMLENFQEIARLAKCEKNSQLSNHALVEKDDFEMHVRAKNMVRAGESLTKLVADLKQNLILNDFANMNKSLGAKSRVCRKQADEIDRRLHSLLDDLTTHLYIIEEEYYMSNYK